MRVAITSDLHVEHHLEVVGRVAARLGQVEPDVALVLGDLCSDLSLLSRSLRLLARAFAGTLLFLPGNHELWCGGPSGDGPNSRERWETVLPRVARRSGAVGLGTTPVTLHGVTFVGVTGWYDGSLVGRSLRENDLVGARDEAEVHWPDDAGEGLSAADLSRTFVGSLARQCEEAVGAAGALVVATHMVPSAQVIDGARAGGEAVPAARVPTLGSQRLWDEAARQPGLALAVCGHLHARWAGSLRGETGAIPFQVAAVGYPRQVGRDLARHVAERVAVLEV